MQISDNMKLFFKKIGILFLSVIVVDLSLGHGLEYITSHIRVGGQGRDNYIASETNEDLLVFGSSRAVHHYNTPMMDESLNMTCYNCGDDGSGIILSYGRLVMIKERYIPRIIIQDVNPDFDLLLDDNHKYLGWMKSHYKDENIRSIFEDIDKTEKFKMASFLYRYNSRFLQNVVTYITGMANDGGNQGYRPLYGKIEKIHHRNNGEFKESYDFDSLKLKYVNKFIDLSKNSRLVFVVSPIWRGMDSLKLLPIKKICKERGIEFIDYSNCSKYVHNDKYFVDEIHLNSDGANEFTKDLISELRKKRKNHEI